MTSLHLRHQLLLLRFVAKILALPSQNNYVLPANNRLGRVYDLRSSFITPADIRAFEIARRYNPTTSSCRCAIVSSVRKAFLAASQNKCLAGFRSTSKKSCHLTKLKLLVRSVLVEYIKQHTIVYTVGSLTERGVGSAFDIEGASQFWTLPKEAVYTSVSFTHLDVYKRQLI